MNTQKNAPGMRFFKSAIAFSLSLFTVAGALAQKGEPAEIRNVSVAEFRAAIDSLEGEVIVDLRTPEELKGGKIPGARVIDFSQPGFEAAIDDLERKKVYLLYCAAGGRSGKTAQLMRRMGFKKVYNMEAGFRGWLKDKMPVEKTGK